MPSLPSRRAFFSLALVAGLAHAGAAFASDAHPNDVARFLAGLPPAAGSPLEALTADPGWRHHASHLDNAWQRIENSQLSHVRNWSAANLPKPNRTLLYMFSGPDYLYARNFFPHADTYLFSGLEAPGSTPNLAAMPPEDRQRGLDTLRSSIRNILWTSFFVTADMQKDLHGQGFLGVLPVLYVFLARSGMEIRSVTHHRLTDEGALEPVPEPRPTRPAVMQITFYDRPNATERTLYYFSVDLSNAGLQNGAFLKFLDRQGPSDAFIKSASYLVHTAGFSRIRNAILERSTRIVQDDTGVRLDDYDPAVWQITPFGRYVRPISSFDHMFQPSMDQLYQTANPPALTFRLGYGYGPHTTSILLANRR